MLFWVANSLLIPDVIILLLLFARALILIGGTYNMYIAKRKNDRAFDALVKEGRTDELRQSLPANDNSLYVCYLRDLLSHTPSDDYAECSCSPSSKTRRKKTSPSPRCWPDRARAAV